MDEKTIKRLANKAQSNYTKQNNLMLENSRGLDNLILIVSTGVFALSVNYLTDLKKAEIPEIMIGSWWLLAAAIILHTLAYKKSIQYAKEASQKYLDWANIKKFQPEDYDPHKELRNLNAQISLLESWVLWLTIFGVIGLLIFASVNLLSNKSSLETKDQPQTIINNYYAVPNK